MKIDFIVCHYDEIGLKGGNRKFFEEKLVSNIKDMLTRSFPGCFESVRRISGRIIIGLKPEGKISFEEMKSILKNVFGISYFSPVFSVKQDMDVIKNKSVEILEEKEFENFRISTKRSNKEYRLTSQQVNVEVGSFVVEKMNKKVKLEDSDIDLRIEIVENKAFLYTERVEGPGGLPVGTAGKLIGLLSGGIDSPVSSYYLVKRGAKLVFVHFHSAPYTMQSSVDKVEELVTVLNQFQTKSKIYFVPFGNIQKEIMFNTPEKLRVILYRRFMFAIAQEIAKKEGALGFVTGESLGQVASQTLENMGVVENAVTLPVFRPLIGFDKKEIIEKAEEIGSYDISIRPHDDCCSLFLPKHPETKAKLNEVLEAEKKLDVIGLIGKTIQETEVKVFD